MDQSVEQCIPQPAETRESWLSVVRERNDQSESRKNHSPPRITVGLHMKVIHLSKDHRYCVLREGEVDIVKIIQLVNNQKKRK